MCQSAVPTEVENAPKTIKAEFPPLFGSHLPLLLSGSWTLQREAASIDKLLCDF